MNCNKLNLSKDRICWIALIIFALMCTLKMAKFCLSGAILNPDISLYLISGLKYAGLDYFNVTNPQDLYYTPIISFLTSLIFRWGYIDKNAIIIVTSIICFFSYIGVYSFLKIRFDSLLSLAGAVIYGSTVVVIFNLSKGTIDIPAMTISLFALYFAVLAIDRNPKFFLISFPLLVISFFTKYVSGFILPLIFLYYLMKRDFVGNLDSLLSRDLPLKDKLKAYLLSDEFKYLLISAVISLILAAVICKTLILDFGGQLSFFQQSMNSFNHHDGEFSVLIPNKSFYLDEFHKILFGKYEFGGLLSGLLYLIVGSSIIITIWKLVQAIKGKKSQESPFKTKHFRMILAISFVILLAGSFVGFKIIENNMISNICFLASVVALHALMKDYVDNKCLSMALLYFSFFITYLIFLSLYSIQTFRYAIPLVVPFIFIVVWSLDTIFTSLAPEEYGSKCELNRDYTRLHDIIIIVLILLFLASTIYFIAPMEYERSNIRYQELHYKGYCNDLADVCEYIMETDPDYHSKSFASFLNSERTIRWYLNVNVTVIENEGFDLRDFDGSRYVIVYNNVRLDNYHLVKKFGDFNLYYHN